MNVNQIGPIEDAIRLDPQYVKACNIRSVVHGNLCKYERTIED